VIMETESTSETSGNYQVTQRGHLRGLIKLAPVRSQTDGRPPITLLVNSPGSSVQVSEPTVR
jgi:hypothetical protein